MKSWKRIKTILRHVLPEQVVYRLAVSERVWMTKMCRAARAVLGSHSAPSGLKMTRYDSMRGQTFFGYYDFSPFSGDGRRLLGLSAPETNAPPTAKQEVQVGYFDCNRPSSFRQIGSSSTWCWQQGCRLRWHPRESNVLIVYNRLVNGDYGAVIQSIENGEIVSRFDIPFYDLSPDGETAATLNFSRLNRLRPGYGYVNVPDDTASDPSPESDGVWLYDLRSQTRQLLVSLKELAHLNPLNSMNGSQHYVNHLSFSPSGERLLFFHLWTQGSSWCNRLLIWDLNKEKCSIVNEQGKVSHYAWRTDDELLVTIWHARESVSYYLWDFRENTGNVVMHTLKEDGHPSFSPDGSRVLTDSYPDRYSEQRLLMGAWGDEPKEIARFWTPPAMQILHAGEVRCDLHPRWDRRGKRVCVDSAQDGGRAMYVIELE